MKQPSLQRWYNWPQHYHATLRPWYVLIRICVFLPFVFITALLLWVSLVLMDGKSTAEDFRKNLL